MRRTQLWLLALTLAACDPEGSTDFEVPATCFAAGTTVDVSGPDPSDPLTLFYGPQGGQHVYLPLVLRGVDPRTTRVRVVLTRSVDDQIVADQRFTRFEPGEGECDVVLPRTELFVASARTDGLLASARVEVMDEPRNGERTFDALCVTSDAPCDAAPPLALEVNGALVAPGDRVFLDDEGQLTLRVDPASHGAGDLWGRAGSARIDSMPGEPLRLTATDGESLAVRLVLSRLASPFSGGLLARFDGALEVGCDVLDAATCGTDRTCDRAASGGPTRCRTPGDVASGAPCASPDDCVTGATCFEDTCRAWCDPAAPACAEGERCAATVDAGLCQP